MEKSYLLGEQEVPKSDPDLAELLSIKKRLDHQLDVATLEYPLFPSMDLAKTQRKPVAERPETDPAQDTPNSDFSISVQDSSSTSDSDCEIPSVSHAMKTYRYSTFKRSQIIILKRPLRRKDPEDKLVTRHRLHVNINYWQDEKDKYTPKYVQGLGYNKHGLCPYCLRLFNMKTSGYLKHMLHIHGVMGQNKIELPLFLSSREGYTGKVQVLCECGDWIGLEQGSNAKMTLSNYYKHAAAHYKL